MQPSNEDTCTLCPKPLKKFALFPAYMPKLEFNRILLQIQRGKKRIHISRTFITIESDPTKYKIAGQSHRIVKSRLCNFELAAVTSFIIEKGHAVIAKRDSLQFGLHLSQKIDIIFCHGDPPCPM